MKRYHAYGLAIITGVVSKALVDYGLGIIAITSAFSGGVFTAFVLVRIWSGEHD